MAFLAARGGTERPQPPSESVDAREGSSAKKGAHACSSTSPFGRGRLDTMLRPLEAGEDDNDEDELVGDPWEGAEDLAREDLEEWLRTSRPWAVGLATVVSPDDDEGEGEGEGEGREGEQEGESSVT